MLTVHIRVCSGLCMIFPLNIYHFSLLALVDTPFQHVYCVFMFITPLHNCDTDDNKFVHSPNTMFVICCLLHYRTIVMFFCTLKKVHVLSYNIVKYV